MPLLWQSLHLRNYYLMNYWVIADTHIGHSMLVAKGHRPADYAEKLLLNIERLCRKGDILIHLGDVCFGNDAANNLLMVSAAREARRWLVRGNHDDKSLNWYLEHGWDFAFESFRLNIFGCRILFSHEPQAAGDYELNIHGHLHAGDHRDVPDSIRHAGQVLVSMEALDYRPANLKDLVETYWL